jgi:hypothetical protein
MMDDGLWERASAIFKERESSKNCQSFNGPGRPHHPAQRLRWWIPSAKTPFESSNDQFFIKPHHFLN